MAGEDDKGKGKTGVTLNHARIQSRRDADELRSGWATALDALKRTVSERTAALQRVVESTLDAGLFVHGIRESPIAGTTGNIEYLLWARSDPSDTRRAEDEHDEHPVTSHPARHAPVAD